MDKFNKFYILSAGLGLSLVFCVSRVDAKEYFNPHLLEMDSANNPSLDLSLFAKNEVPPGDYNVDIYINGNIVDTKTISFRKLPEASSDSPEVGACLSVAQLKAWNVRVDDYFKDNTSKCVDIHAIPKVQESIDLSQQRYDLIIPQVALFNRARGYVSEDKWDEGITAALLNYSVSGQQDLHHRNGVDSSNQFISLQPGINIGAWRFRNYSTYSHSHDSSEWDSVYTYVYRDIKALKSQFMAGQSTTKGGIFDSVGFTGVQLTSDNDMKPDSMQGFAPVIRGIARTNAEVTVYQNGHSIYKATVPPGAFEFSDMYPTGSSGDLRVVIKESDGSESSFIVPYASLPVLQREGQVQYGLVAGKTRQDGDATKEFNFVQGSAAWGAWKGGTLYGGYIQAENKYANLTAGIGFNLGDIGALSLDASQSWATIPQHDNKKQEQRSEGQSYRIRYSKTLALTDTDISVAGYKYSTSGYLAFQDFLNSWNTGNSPYNDGRERNRYDVTVSQNFSFGTFSLSMFNESYWNSQRANSLNVGFSSAWGPVTYSVNYAHNKNISGDNNDEYYANDNVFSLSLNVPFSAFSNSETAQNISSNFSVNTSKHGDTTSNVGVSGTAMENNQLNWQVSEGYSANSEATNGNVSVGYQSSYGDVSAGYSYDDYSRRLNYSLRGGAVLHSGGLTLSRQLNDSAVLVETPGVSGVPVNGQTNVHTDMFGNAIVPFVRPYHSTQISLNMADSNIENADIDNVNKVVVPTEGAIVRAKYATWLGRKAMMTMMYKGKPVPFGAIVTQSNNNSDDVRSQIVGEDGEVYLTGLSDKGKLFVKWGDTNDKQCGVDYSLANATAQADILFIKALCNPVLGGQ